MVSSFKNSNHLKISVQVFAHVSILTVLCSSCMPDPLEVKNIPTVTPEIVVSSQIVPDQSIMISLTKTISALDADEDTDPEDLLDQIVVDDAVVMITGPQGTDTLRALGAGVYGSEPITLVPGYEYQMKVYSKSLGEISARTVVQPKVKFRDVAANLFYSESGDILAQVDYSVKDSVNKNYYMVSTQKLKQGQVLKNIVNPKSYTRLLSDGDFNGSTFREQFKDFSSKYEPGDTIAVTLSNISEEYYTFMQRRIDNRFGFIEFFSEPVNYPTNIQGGRGFFNLYVPDVRTFVLY